jgi:hypothetical protein
MCVAGTIFSIWFLVRDWGHYITACLFCLTEKTCVLPFGFTCLRAGDKGCIPFSRSAYLYLLERKDSKYSLSEHMGSDLPRSKTPPLVANRTNLAEVSAIRTRDTGDGGVAADFPLSASQTCNSRAPTTFFDWAFIFIFPLLAVGLRCLLIICRRLMC